MDTMFFCLLACNACSGEIRTRKYQEIQVKGSIMHWLAIVICLRVFWGGVSCSMGPRLCRRARWGEWSLEMLPTRRVWRMVLYSSWVVQAELTHSARLLYVRKRHPLQRILYPVIPSLCQPFSLPCRHPVFHRRDAGARGGAAATIREGCACTIPLSPTALSTPKAESDVDVEQGS